MCRKKKSDDCDKAVIRSSTMQKDNKRREKQTQCGMYMRSIGYDVRGKPSGKKSINVVVGGPGDV